MNSIEDAAMTEEEKAELMDSWELRWDEFIDSRVSKRKESNH